MKRGDLVLTPKGPGRVARIQMQDGPPYTVPWQVYVQLVSDPECWAAFHASDVRAVDATGDTDDAN